jgi:Retrotransposon gag protein
MYHLQNKQDSLVQGGMSVTEYFSELNNMWEQMDLFDPLTMKCTEDALFFENWLNKRRIFHFLAGLNPEFEPTRQSLWQRILLPILRDAFGAVVQEESKRKAMLALPVQEGSTMLSQPYVNLQSGKICDYCHKRNHTRENCWHLHGKSTRGQSCGR